MALCADVLSIILDLLGDKSSLLSRNIRDRYFRKNGIWIHLGRKYHKTYIFPDKFYDYLVNLSLMDTGIESFAAKDGQIVNIIAKFISMFNHASNDKIITWMFKNTVLLTNTEIENLKYFPGVIRASGVTGIMDRSNIDILRKRKIVGCTLNGGLPFMFDFLDDIREIDCSIRLHYCIDYCCEKIPDWMADKITYAWYSFLSKNTTYKNVIELLDDNNFLEEYNENNFPNIKILKTNPSNLAYIVNKIPFILNMVFVRSLTSEHLSIIRKYQPMINLVVYDENKVRDYDNLIQLGITREDNIIITCNCNDITRFYSTFKLYRNFRTIFHLILSSPEHSLVFSDLLDLNHLGYDILVQVKVYSDTELDNIVDHAINIYKTIGVFLNFSDIHRGSMGNIEEYLSIRDRVLSGYPEVLL